MDIKNKKIHYYWIDMLRFLAALTVVIAHTRVAVFLEYGALGKAYRTLPVTAAFAVTRVAHEAVIVFFVLSGFLVGGRLTERVSGNGFRPGSYAVDRLVRIMLPLIPALVLTAAVRIIIDGHFSYAELIGNLFSLQGIFFEPFGKNGPLWSLSYEVWFYTLAFSVGILVMRKKLSVLPGILFIISISVFTALSPVYLFCWLIGAAAYVWRPEKFSIKYLLFAVILFFLSVASIQIGYPSVSVSVSKIKEFVPSLDISRLLLSVSFALLIQQLILLRPKSRTALNFDKAGTYLAAFSYTLYLTHYPLLQLLGHLGVKRSDSVDFDSLTVFGVNILLCLIFAWIMYQMFEKHTGKMKDYVRKFTDVFKRT